MEHKPSLSDLIESIRDQAFKLPPPPLYQLQPPWGHWHELPAKLNIFFGYPIVDTFPNTLK